LKDLKARLKNREEGKEISIMYINIVPNYANSGGNNKKNHPNSE
jgi:hypothetical protein